MQKPCHDNYYTTFQSYGAMLSAYENQTRRSQWRRCKVNSLQIESLGKLSPLRANLSAFVPGTSQEAVEDTAENLGLAMRVDGELYPLRTTAYKSLLDRAKISGSALAKLNREVLAQVLNACLRLYPAEALILIRDEKVSAVHSGDEADYSILPMDELLKTLQTKLNGRFGQSQFVSGYGDHAITSALWRLPDQKEDLLGLYAKLLDSQGKKNLAASIPFQSAAVFLLTTDITKESAILRPRLNSCLPGLGIRLPGSGRFWRFLWSIRSMS